MMKALLTMFLLFVYFPFYGQNGSALSSGAIIRRPIKDVQFLYHYGIMLDDKVVHYNQTGLHVSSLDSFAQGATVTVLQKGLVGDEYKTFRERAKNVIKQYRSSKYDAIHNNCEHFVMEMRYGIKQSIQSDAIQTYVKNYYPSVRQNILSSHPNSKVFVDLIDTYLAKNFK